MRIEIDGVEADSANMMNLFHELIEQSIEVTLNHIYEENLIIITTIAKS